MAEMAGFFSPPPSDQSFLFCVLEYPSAPVVTLLHAARVFLPCHNVSFCLKGFFPIRTDFFQIFISHACGVLSLNLSQLASFVEYFTHPLTQSVFIPYLTYCTFFFYIRTHFFPGVFPPFSHGAPFFVSLSVARQSPCFFVLFVSFPAVSFSLSRQVLPCLSLASL